eukprot:3124351-Prymnesium_polylepis.2
MQKDGRHNHLHTPPGGCHRALVSFPRRARIQGVLCLPRRIVSGLRLQRADKGEVRVDVACRHRRPRLRVPRRTQVRVCPAFVFCIGWERLAAHHADKQQAQRSADHPHELSLHERVLDIGVAVRVGPEPP